jgi:hypothetical protein
LCRFSPAFQLSGFSLQVSSLIPDPAFCIRPGAALGSFARPFDVRGWMLDPGVLTDIFCGLLGSTGPAESPETFTFSRERHVKVDDKVADAVLGRFHKGKEQFVALLEGKSARNPLDHPFAGRRMSAVD